MLTPSASLIARPILESPVFRRLAGVSFLGALSPRLLPRCPDHPLASCAWWSAERSAHDGDRAAHSLAVADWALALCRRLGFSETEQRLAAAWGLLHDIATWPLSHTGEAAFTSILGFRHGDVRRAVILGDAPPAMRLRAQLVDMGAPPDDLAGLFEGRARAGRLGVALYSPINPDALEGASRTSAALGMPAPDPSAVLSALDVVDGEAVVKSEPSSPVLAFWRAKRGMYAEYIHTPAAARFESRWTQALQERFQGVSLEESFALSDDYVVDEALRIGLPDFQGERRFRPPPRHSFSAGLQDAERLPQDVPLADLHSHLVTR